MTSQQAFEIDPSAGRIDAVAGPKAGVGPADLVAPALDLDPTYPAAVLASRAPPVASVAAAWSGTSAWLSRASASCP